MRNAKTAFGLKGFAAGLALAAAVGCGTDPGGPASDPPGKGADTPAATTMTPVAALPLANGNVLEFYDFGSKALISETGLAGVDPAYTPTDDPDASQLVSIWKGLAPETAVPQSLRDLQERLMNLPPDLDDDTETVPTVVEGAELPEPQLPGGDGDLLAAPDGCNNGCCDRQWLSTFSQCQTGHTINWFNFNFGYSTINAGSVITYESVVCSAIGTSTFRLAIRDSGGTFNVDEATFRTFRWVAGTTCNPFCHFVTRTVSSTVNGSTDQHLHTYCGGINK
jgi:hypothetical protein